MTGFDVIFNFDFWILKFWSHKVVMNLWAVVSIFFLFFACCFPLPFSFLLDLESDRSLTHLWFVTATHQRLFDEYLLKINKALSFAQLELRGCRNQYDGQVYYGVVNNVSDEQSKLGTKYSVPQIAFYKAIVSISEMFYY